MYFIFTSNSRMGRLLESSRNIQIATFILVLISLSLGQIARWDLLEQISMADRYNISNSFYPDKYDQHPSGVSVYFPGVALLASFISTIVPASLIVQTMLLLAGLLTVAFLLIQREITKDIDSSYTGNAFWPLAIVFSLFFAREWVIYAVEFKPDTIAYLVGSASILLSRRTYSRQISYFLSIFFGLIAGLALVFKQQYVVFVLGYLLFSFFFKKREDFFFLFGCLATSTLVLYFMKSSGDAWFWTISVLSDDGFLNYKQWTKDHFVFFLKLGMLLCALIVGIRVNIIGSSYKVLSTLISTYKSSPWVTIIFVSFLAAFISSWKVGGNAGNTAFGLMLFFPLFLLLLSRVNASLLILAGWLVIGLNVPFAINSLKRYKLADELVQATMSISEKDCVKVLTGSDVYFATRSKFLHCNTTNYWTIALRDSTSSDIEFNRMVESREFKYIISENWPINNKILKDSKNYQILFENRIGILAKMID